MKRRRRDQGLDHGRARLALLLTLNRPGRASRRPRIRALSTPHLSERDAVKKRHLGPRSPSPRAWYRMRMQARPAAAPRVRPPRGTVPSSDGCAIPTDRQGPVGEGLDAGCVGKWRTGCGLEAAWTMLAGWTTMVAPRSRLRRSRCLQEVRLVVLSATTCRVYSAGRL